MRYENGGRDLSLYIGLNADNIDYKPMLRILRDVTNDPIFISASNYSMQEQGEAHDLGADLFGQVGETPEDNYKAVLQKINQLNGRARQRKIPIQIISFGDILFAPSYHRAFIKDAELFLTKIEMDILHHMMLKPGRILTQDLICQKFIDGDNQVSANSIYSLMKRLRKKIKDLSRFDYIEAVRDMGYRLQSKTNKEG